MKRCTKCGVEKELDRFYKQKDCKDGLTPNCKECRKADVARYQRDNREKVNAYQRQRRAGLDESERTHLREYQREWTQGPGRAKYLATRRRFRERNKEKIAAAWAVYYEKNRERLLAHSAAYRAANPDCRKSAPSRGSEKKREYRERRRALLLDAFVENVDFDLILLRDEGYCGICGEPIMELTIEIDHIIPLAAGGWHGPDNVQLAHRSCNRRKWMRLPS